MVMYINFHCMGIIWHTSITFSLFLISSGRARSQISPYQVANLTIPLHSTLNLKQTKNSFFFPQRFMYLEKYIKAWKGRNKIPKHIQLQKKLVLGHDCDHSAPFLIILANAIMSFWWWSLNYSIMHSSPQLNILPLSSQGSLSFQESTPTT